MKNKCDVLVMIWGMEGRDAHALIPIIFLLKEKYHLNVEVRSIFDFSSIDLLKPKVLLTNGCTGSITTFEVTKYASLRGIYVVSLHAEGAFRQESIKEMLWGWNKEKKIYVDKWFMWNENAYRWSVENFPYVKNKLAVSGSVGHEKYLMVCDDNDLKSKILGRKFTSIVFYAAWGFDLQIRLYEQGKLVQDPNVERLKTVEMLKSAIEAFPDKLFILKYHPGTLDESKTEIYNYFNDYKNVLILHDEYPIYKLIRISDLVMVYDSTTCIDAWLSGKTTVHLCNDNSGYKSIREGSLVPRTKNELLGYTSDLFKRGSVDNFEQKKEVRSKIIRETFGDLSSKPSLSIASHIFDNLNHAKKATRSRSILFLIRGKLNKIFYLYRFLPCPRSCSAMRRHYRPEAFNLEYENMFKMMRTYFNLSS